VITFKQNKIILQDQKPPANPTSEELAKLVLKRMGLDPRKSGSTDRMFQTMLELYERSKLAHREKKPEQAVMTVEEMGMYAGITRQTMYDYLRRWIDLNMIVKTSYIKDNKVIIGYKLNGLTLEAAYDKAMSRITSNLNETKQYLNQLQKLIKNEKISQSMGGKPQETTAEETTEEQEETGKKPEQEQVEEVQEPETPTTEEQEEPQEPNPDD